MPLLKRKPFKRNTIPEGLKDDDQVFYCKQTKEVFKSYDEYFERVMLTNSVIWQCALTGRPELTFSEALTSEKTARKLLRQFPSAMRGPVVLVASQTKRSALKELVDDVFNFVKDRYFVEEKLDVMNEKGHGCRFCKIVKIIRSESYDSSKFYEPGAIMYQVEAIDDEKEPKRWTARGELLRRDKTVFTKEKTKLFLKQHVEGLNAALRVKEESLQKYVINRGLKMEETFVGKTPDFEISKKLQLLQEKNSKKGEKVTTSKGRKSGGGKQGDITKYLNSSGTGSKALSSEDKKKRDENSKKFRADMEAKRKEKADLEAEKQKKVAEEKARVLAKVQATVREYNQIREDLDLTDQRVIPKGKLISTLIDQKYFANFIKVLEFLHSFPEVLSISDKFPYGINIETLERALILKEVNGPLSDILQVLLGTVFTLQIEEENEVESEYRVNGDVPVKHSKVEQMRNASRAHIWAAQHYSTKVNEMVMDSTTISELLRLHLLGSGAIVSDRSSKYRFAARGGYRSQDDPGLILNIKYPHINKFLSQFSFFQMPTKDILRIFGCLTDQILTYSNVRDIIEERLEKSVSAKLEYRNVKTNEGRRERKLIEEKKTLQEENKVLVAGFSEESPSKKESLIEKAEAELEQKIAKLDAQSVKDRHQHLKDLKAQVSIFFNHQTFLGCDRAFRNYYIFESIPGLFVENDITFSGKCQDQCVKNNPALAHCTKEQRYGIIKQMVTTDESGASDDKENKADINGAAQDKTVSNGKKENEIDMQKDLFMCNCDPVTCSVHSDSPERSPWTYFNTADEVDALIESLNVRGFREKNLKETLEASRDLIVDYIKDCPATKLRVLMDEEEKADEMKKIVRRMTKKYENANLSRGAGTDPNEIYDLTLREILLDFEQKLNFGCLGVLKVKDRNLWRKYIEDLEYYALDDNLKWGNERKIHNGLSNGHDKENNGNIEENEASEDTASSVGDIEPAHTFDSGNCTDMESEEDDEAKMKTSDMEAVKLKVKNLAMALLQIEQGIDIKFIRAPFGPTKELKDKDAMAKAMDTCKKKILRWEESLMKATSYAQVFLHFNILHDSILWSRSAQRVGCMICRRKNDPEQTLLCDECNKGWHIFCLKPKLTTIPQGDWFCPRCRPDDYKPKTSTKKRKVFVEEEVEESEDEENTADESAVESGSDSDSEICMVCQFSGELCHCSFCDMQCHPECAKPTQKKANVKNWKCWKCTSAQQRSDRIKRRRMDKDEEDESDKSESEEEQPSKVRKIEKPTGRRSKRAYEESEDLESSEDEDYDMKDKKLSNRRSSYKHSRKSSPERPSRRSSKKFVEESAAERRASKRSLDIFNTISLSTLIDEIIKHKNSWPFSKPVSANEVPDYFDVIKKPMDFGKVKSKLNLGAYRTNEEAMKDIELVFYNCDLYNVADSEIYKAGAKLEKYVLKRCKDLNLQFQPSDMVAN